MNIDKTILSVAVTLAILGSVFFVIERVFGRGRKPPKHPLDRADKIAHVVGGAMLGALASSFSVMELVFSVLVSENGTLWLPATVGCVSMVLGGIVGGLIGTRFIDWMSDNWHEFHRIHSQFRQD